MNTDEILQQRGLLEAARAAGWESHRASGRDGWAYPVTSSKTPGHKRWKAADKDGKAKYFWLEPHEADERPRYYFVNGIKDAIARDNGRLYIAGGEPDVLALYAAGAHNALCWFGEKNVPESLVADLKALGVVAVTYAPDRDDTGSEAAEIIQAALDGSGVALSVLRLPGEAGSHYDLNALWIECGFDTDAFWQRMRGLEVVNVPRRHTHIDWDVAYEEWCLDIERVATLAWKVDKDRKGEWSKALFSSPVRTDSDPSARWNYKAHGFKDFGTEEFYNTHQVAEICGAPSWESHKAQLIRDADESPLLYGDIARKAPQAKREQVRQQATREQVRVVTSDEAIATVMEWLEGKVPPSEPILSPYPAMHQLGGMARLWERRKLIYIIGAAGMGKTAFMETGADTLRRNGYSVIYWGPEWSPEEVQMKAIARYGGPSLERQRDDHLYAQQVQKGIPEAKRYGKPLSDVDREKAYRIACQIAAWPGKAWYIDKANISIESVMETVRDIATKARGLGQDAAVFFCDYLQKAKLPGSAGRWDELENKANVISYGCIEANLVGVLASQVGKSDSRQLRKNTKLDESSAQGLSDQLCNLFVTLNPVFDRDENRLEKGVIGVEKNSSGQVPVRVTVKTALYRHFWSDEITSIDEAHEYQGSTFTDKTGGSDA